MEKHTHAAAVDLGATNVRAALIRRDGTIDSYCTEPVKDEDGISVTGQILSMLSSILDETGIMPEAAGISTAGPVDRKAGSVVRSPNMRCRNILLRDPLEHFLGVPVTMLTDCKAGVLGEYVYGGADSANTVVYLTFSTGIGAGIISDGHLLSGAGGNAGEVGHLFVDSQYRLPCGCGGYGHWEAYASGTGIPNFFRAFCDQPPEKSLTGILKDPLYREFTGELARINGRGLSSVIAVYNPDLIILDGPVARNYPSLLAGNRYIEHYLELPEIRISALEGRAPLLGAAAAAFQGLP